MNATTRKTPAEHLAARHGYDLASAFRHTLFLVILTVAACSSTTTQNVSDRAPMKSEIERMYATVFDNVHKMYLEEIPVDRLAMTGLAGLRRIEAATTVRRVGNRVSLLVNDTEVGSVAEPAVNDADSWAAAVEDLIEAGRKASAKLSDADIEYIYKVTFDSLLADLDRYTRYDGKLAGRRNRESREGFGGIGVGVVKDSDGVRVENITPELPAARAGVQPGDIFTAVDGTPLRGLSLRRSVQLLRGPMGKPVQVTVQRESRPDAFVLTISRTRIIPVTVHYKAYGNLAYLHVTGFNQDTTSELRAGVERANREFRSTLVGLVIDLRGNPGGLLDQAVSAADLFLHDGRISTTRGRHPDSLQLFDASADEIARGLPIVVLVDGASASASEVLAAALQDRSRAVLVGSSSFGKGTVQTVIRLPNDGELILTWARLHSPEGHVINRVGVVPTLCTSSAKNVADVLKDGFKANSPYRQIATRATTDLETAKAITKQCPWQPHEGDDIDIAVAKRILERPELYQNALRLPAPIAGR